MFEKILPASIAAATLFGSAAYVLAVLGGEVMASGPKPGVKGDRLDIRPLGAACSQSAWPYYEPACLRDRRRPAGRAREVRVVSAERLSFAHPAVHIAR